MRDKVNNDNVNYATKTYKLLSDIDFVDLEDWIPIGATMENPFKGTFDGNGKVIRNINMGSLAAPSKNNLAGLFGCIYGGSVKNLGIGWKCINTTGSLVYVGGIAGYNNGSSITNCFISGQISSSSGAAYVGGIVGSNYSGIINGCNSIGTIEGLSLTYGTIYLGGIAGDNSGTILNSYHKGNVTASSSLSDVYCGGITGINESTIINCYAITKVYGNSVSRGCLTGGIVGQNKKIVTNCYAAGSVNSIANNSNFVCTVGGIAGWNYTIGKLTYCLALNDTLTSISGSTNTYEGINRIAYYTNGGTLQNNYASSKIVMRMGIAASNLNTVSNKSGLNHGANLIEQPLTLLNNWVLNNTNINGVENKRWKVVQGVNDGLPIFEDQFSTGINSFGLNKKNLARIYVANDEIIIESENVGQIKIFNVNGQLVSQQIANNNITKIPMKQNGVYIVVILDRTGRKLINSQKVISVY